jgi:hypothetical protein
MRLRTEHGNNARVQFPEFGTFEFDPEGEVPDEYKGAIDHLLADGYTIVGEKAQAQKDEPGKVEIPPKEEKLVESNLICPDCGKESKTPQGLAGHKRFCKGKPE